MDYHVFKTLLNNYFLRHIGGNKRATFFNIKQTYPALNDITHNYSVIKTEFDTLLQSRPVLPLYHEIDPGEEQISKTTDKDWKVFMLYLLGHKPAANRQLCPQTCQLIDKIPNLIQAFFSILEPGKNIPLHEGPYLGYLRYHLGIKIPISNPPTLIVNSKEYTWREGEGVLFDDSWPHAVVNLSQDYRVVLIIDVLRPMPWLPTLLNKVVTGLLARYTYGSRVIKRVKGYQVSDKPLIN